MVKEESPLNREALLKITQCGGGPISVAERVEELREEMVEYEREEGYDLVQKSHSDHPTITFRGADGAIYHVNSAGEATKDVVIKKPSYKGIPLLTETRHIKSPITPVEFSRAYREALDHQAENAGKGHISLDQIETGLPFLGIRKRSRKK